MAILQELLNPSVVTGIVQRVKATGDVLQRHFGVQMGAKADLVTGRSYTYDILDPTRAAAFGRRPGTAAAVADPVAVGNQTVKIPRVYEKLILDYETLNNIRTLGENAGSRDRLGKQYVERQTRELKRRVNNFFELMLAGLLRQGALYLKYSGDDLIPTFSLGSDLGDTIDFLVPAAHKTKLDMLGAGDILGVSWDNAAAPIPHDIMQINEAFMANAGQPLKHVYLTSPVWINVLKNTDVRNLAGSSNQPFAKYDMEPDKGPDGNNTGLFHATLPFCPWLEWHVYDGMLDVDGTSTKLLRDTYATFTVEHRGQSWLKRVEGSEPVLETVVSPVQERFGYTAWMRPQVDPARVELHSLMNAFLELNTPKAVAIGLCIY